MFSGLFLSIYSCANLLSEIKPPGHIGVGVVLLVGALMKLRLDGLSLYWELSKYCKKKKNLN